MKKTLRLLSLAVLTVGLLGSCSKINERIDGLEKRVDGIENEKIASINTQIEKINTSIADLGTIRESIGNLKTAAETNAKELAERKKAEEVLGGRTDKLEEEIQAINKQVADLQAADAALGQRIDELKTFVSDTLRAYATTEWVEATFSTLEQYETTCDTIAKIDARIGALDARLSKEIAGLVESLKAWVNKQFEGYYTAAEVDAIVEGLQAQIDTLSKGDPRVDSLAAELTATKAAIETAKDSIRTEYKTAITDAITQSEGKMTSAINSAIAEVNSKITELTNDVNELKNRVNALTGRVDALEKMIQSVTILPEYTDGSVKADEGTLTVKFVVSPAGSVKEVTKDSILVFVDQAKANKTKAPSYYTAVAVSNAEVNTQTGEVEITADITCQAQKALETNDGLAVAVNVTNGGLSDFTSKFVPVTFAMKAAPQGIIPGAVFTVHKQDCNVRKVYFSKGNLTATGEAGSYSWEFAENQYDFIGSASGRADIFKWSTEGDGNFKDWGIEYCTQEHLEEGTWRTMTKDEWTYLLTERVVNGGTGNGHAYSYPITYNGKIGIAIYPDNYSNVTLVPEVDYQGIPLGVVFLPSDGNGAGNYWSSDKDNANAWCGVSFNKAGKITVPNSNAIDNLSSVRLVSDAPLCPVPEYSATRVLSISLDKTSLEMKNGDEPKLKVTFSPVDATDKFVTWKSSNEKVATVDGGGNVTGVGGGTAKITATTADGLKTASCIVKVTYVPNYLNGVFTVNEDGKKVNFSKGNLYWDVATGSFKFESDQSETSKIDWDDNFLWDTNHIRMFHWSKTASVAYTIDYDYPDEDDSDILFTNATAETANPNFKVSGEKGQYRTLSPDEWQYLIDTHEMKWVTVCRDGEHAVGGYAIAPDGFEGTIGDSYESPEALAATNLVFLPCTGWFDGMSDLYDLDWYGNYWASTFCAAVLFGDGEDINIQEGEWGCENMFAIRLVRDCQDE